MDTDDKKINEGIKKFDTFFDAVQDKDIVLRHSVTVEWLERIPNVKDKIIKEGTDEARQKNVAFLKSQHTSRQSDIKNFVKVIEEAGTPVTSVNYGCSFFDKTQEGIKSMLELFLSDEGTENLPPCLQELRNSKEATELRELLKSGAKPNIKVVKLS